MKGDRDKSEQQLDEILDSTLAHYSNAEPRAGLEDRILANLRTQPENVSRGWDWNWTSMMWGGAALAAVVLVAILLLFLTGQHRESQGAPNAIASNIHTTPQITPPVKATAARRRISTTKRLMTRSNAASSGRQEVAAVPHQAVFPSPTPPSEQERMLLSYVHRTPKEILVAVSEEQQQHEQEWLEQMNQLQESAQKSGSL